MLNPFFYPSLASALDHVRSFAGSVFLITLGVELMLRSLQMGGADRD